jgi:uncharacterized phosphosugar-binding protein
LTTVAITSLDNYRKRESTHSSGKKLPDVADMVIDNCTPAEDALVKIEGWKAPVAAGSTVAFITIAMAIVAQVAAELGEKGLTPPVFVSPNVVGIAPGEMNRVYSEYEGKLRRDGEVASVQGGVTGDQQPVASEEKKEKKRITQRRRVR